jgi:hypothetical protein
MLYRDRLDDEFKNSTPEVFLARYDLKLSDFSGGEDKIFYVASVVGCGLDRLEREVTDQEISTAIDFFLKNYEEMMKEAIGNRREKIKNLFE